LILGGHIIDNREVRPIRTRLKRDEVASLLREAILSGELLPGERIVELQLARELGTSQTPVREALVSLEKAGLIVRMEHRGTFVAGLEPHELEDICTMRAVLEGFCARLVAHRVSGPDDLRPLEAELERMRRAVGARDGSALTEADIAFHQALYELSDHKLLADTLGSLRERMSLTVKLAVASSTGLLEVAESHVALLDALRSGDADLAEQTARQHVLALIPLTLSATELDQESCEWRPLESPAYRALVEPGDDSGLARSRAG
jgi:DNA-binding GntR family transcriptional regulator